MNRVLSFVKNVVFTSYFNSLKLARIKRVTVAAKNGTSPEAAPIQQSNPGARRLVAGVKVR